MSFSGFYLSAGENEAWENRRRAEIGSEIWDFVVGAGRQNCGGGEGT